jgi:hypothetical protein
MQVKPSGGTCYAAFFLQGVWRSGDTNRSNLQSVGFQVMCPCSVYQSQCEFPLMFRLTCPRSSRTRSYDSFRLSGLRHPHPSGRNSLSSTKTK